MGDSLVGGTRFHQFSILASASESTAEFESWPSLPTQIFREASAEEEPSLIESVQSLSDSGLSCQDVAGGLERNADFQIGADKPNTPNQSPAFRIRGG